MTAQRLCNFKNEINEYFLKLTFFRQILGLLAVKKPYPLISLLFFKCFDVSLVDKLSGTVI